LNIAHLLTVWVIIIRNTDDLSDVLVCLEVDQPQSVVAVEGDEFELLHDLFGFALACAQEIPWNTVLHRASNTASHDEGARHKFKIDERFHVWRKETIDLVCAAVE